MKKEGNFILVLLVIFFAILVLSPGRENKKEITVVSEEELLSETVEVTKDITVTFYNPTTGQCDSDPLITADGSEINLKKLENGELRWCAVSRDLLQVYRYGDEIWIDSENPEIRGWWIIKDTMNIRKKNHIDLLLPENHKTGFGKEKIKIKIQLPRYLVDELGWNE